MHDRLPRLCSGHVHLNFFLQITDNILETVQNRDVVTVEDWQEIICGLLNSSNSNDLE